MRTNLSLYCVPVYNTLTQEIQIGPSQSQQTVWCVKNKSLNRFETDDTLWSSFSALICVRFLSPKITTGSSNTYPHKTHTRWLNWPVFTGPWDGFHFFPAETNFSLTITSSSRLVTSQQFGLKLLSQCLEMANPNISSKQMYGFSLKSCSFLQFLINYTYAVLNINPRSLQTK